MTIKGGYTSSRGKAKEKSQDDARNPEIVVNALESYRAEAIRAREGGLNPRDEQWSRNLDLYWNRFDFSEKANWQAKEVMPEVPTFVDRFSAALKEALMQDPEGFYTVQDPADREGDLGLAIKRMTDVWLSRCGRNQQGTLLGFPAVFEEQMKLAALMAASAVVLWKNDVPGGRVAIESVDPRTVWLDHTYRNLYRIRRIEVDRHEMFKMVSAKDKKGNPLFNLPQINALLTNVENKDRIHREQMTGHSHEVSTPRDPIILDEYIATVVGSDGKVMHDRAVFVVANEQFLIRGPEKIPFSHGKDWLVYSPLVVVPLSVYGRSYMEDFGSMAETFNELTNMLLDAVYTSSMNAFAMVPDLLTNPGQVDSGILPNKIFYLEEGVRAQDFSETLELGTVSPEAFSMWRAIKDELREAARINEIGVGQFAPNSRTSATEIAETQQSTSAMIRSMAQTVESRFLNPILDLTWKTGLQHAQADDPLLSAAATPQLYSALIGQRQNLVKRPITFQAHGISSVVAKGQQLRALLTLLNVMFSSEQLGQAFLQQISIERLVNRLANLSGLDLTDLQATERERLIRSITEPAQQVQQGSPGPQARDVASQGAQAAGLTL